MRKSRPTHGAKPVRCIETGRVYPSMEAAAQYAHCSACNIGQNCLGRQKSAGGYHWEYAEPHERPVYPGNLCKRKDTCRWAAKGSGGKVDNEFRICYYAVLAGKSRDCPADLCDKYEPITEKEARYGREKTRFRIL